MSIENPEEDLNMSSTYSDENNQIQVLSSEIQELKNTIDVLKRIVSNLERHSTTGPAGGRKRKSRRKRKSKRKINTDI